MKTEIHSSSKSAPEQSAWREHVIAVALLGALSLVLFADVLFDTHSMVVGASWTDLGWTDIYKLGGYWRQFGFGELAKGHLVLWNPHTYCGSPYFGGAHAALLYPPNWIFMVLPLALSLNLSFALHLWLLGVLMYAWAFHRRLGAIASTVAGAVLMLSGAVFSKILPGHLGVVCAMAWAPLVLLAIDELIDKFSLGWVLLGATAVAMQVLAGYPPLFFYTALIAGLYGLLNLLRARRPLVSLVAMAMMYIIGVGLSAVQLLTTLSESFETVRSGGLDVRMAGQYSFPPENFVCFITPAFFGGVSQMSYWGRWFPWEVQPFLGVAGVFLAVYGALVGPGDKRRFSVLMVVITLVLALGAYIPPVFRFTREYVPGMNLFRGSCRFLFLATLFLAMLVGVGVHTLVSYRRFCLGSAMMAFLVAVVLVLIGWVMYSWASAPMAGNTWAEILAAMDRTGESWQNKIVFTDKEFICQAGMFAARSILITAATAGVLSLILVLTRLMPRAGYLVAILALTELFVFDRVFQRPTCQLGTGVPLALEEYMRPQGDDTRTLNPFLPTLAMAVDGADLWGYDPFVLRRYMEFMYFTQGLDVRDAPFFQHLGSLRPSGLFSMLRCRSMLVPQGNQVNMLTLSNPMGRLQLIGQYEVHRIPQDVLSAMIEPDFDPRRTVILEEEPEIIPAGVSDAGWAKVTDSSTDSLTIRAELSAPAILLITDAYSKYWQASALPGSSQHRYTIMPANYCLRAVPLAAGRHLFRLDYRPIGFLIGRWVSLGAVAVCLAVLVLHLRLRKRRGGQAAAPPAVTYVNPRRPPEP
jgi:hypothetical protein